MEHIDTVIVGAGQAGLATAYHLTRRDRPCVVLDRASRVGDQWRRQWDSLRLYSPARYDGLPGLPFPGDPWAYPGKDDVAAYLESYAQHWSLPVRLGVAVDGVDPADDGGFVVRTSSVDRPGVTEALHCDHLVVATGTFGRTPVVPEGASELDPGILQLHSSEYRRPAQLRDGPVLVVGASHSGTDIAYELAESRPTTLVGRDCGQIPIRLGSPASRAVFPALRFAWQHVLTRRTPVGRKEMGAIRHHGGPMLRVKREDLAARGVVRSTARFVGASDGMPQLDDGTVLDVANVVWATGFRQSFEWLGLAVPIDDGWPREYRGEVAEVPGLFFCGLSFQYSFSSMLLSGVGRDAEYVAERIARRVSRTAALGQPA